MISQVQPGTFSAVVLAYLAGDEFQQKAAMTQYNYRRLLDAARDAFGDYPVEALKPMLIQTFLDGMKAKPGTQKNAKIALSAVQGWALRYGLIPYAYTIGTKTRKSDGGHKPWTDVEVALAEAHARSFVARAVTLGNQTGQRRSDLVRMTWGDLEVIDGRLGINVKQKKTGVEIWIPFTREFAALIQTWKPAGVTPETTILVNRVGEAFPSAKALSDAWNFETAGKSVDGQLLRPALAPLIGLHLHGLRSTAVVRLLNAGATTGQIRFMVGMSEQMVARYARKGQQKKIALEAISLLDGAPVSNVVPFKREA